MNAGEGELSCLPAAVGHRDGLKENLKWILKSSIHIFLCVPCDHGDKSVHRTMSRHSLPLVMCDTVWCFPGNRRARFKWLCGGVAGSWVDF